MWPGAAREADAGKEADAADLDEADDLDDDEDAEAENLDVAASRGDPVAVTREATRMLWDAYRRHAAASAELREQTNELNRRAIAQAKQLDEALSAMHSRQPSAPISIDMEDLRDILRIGASMFRGEPEQDPEQE